MHEMTPNTPEQFMKKKKDPLSHRMWLHYSLLLPRSQPLFSHGADESITWREFFSSEKTWFDDEAFALPYRKERQQGPLAQLPSFFAAISRVSRIRGGGNFYHSDLLPLPTRKEKEKETPALTVLFSGQIALRTCVYIWAGHDIYGFRHPLKKRMKNARGPLNSFSHFRQEKKLFPNA